MSIDIDAIEEKMADIASDAVGSLLSTMVTDEGTVPSIIIARPNITSPPDYPYIVVDTLGINDADYYEVCSAYNDQGFYTTYRNVDVLLNYHVYGDKSKNIASRLRSYFNFDRVSDELFTDIRCSFTDASSITNVPQLLPDRHIESSDFTLILQTTDDLVDDYVDGTQEITSIDLDGELYRTEDDPEPIPVDVNVSKN